MCIRVCVCTEVKCLPVSFTQLSEGSVGGLYANRFSVFVSLCIHMYVRMFCACMHNYTQTNVRAPLRSCVCVYRYIDT